MSIKLIDAKKGARPQCNLSVQRVEASAWEMFKQHHYLTEEINKSCKCFLFYWEDKVIGFCGVLNTPRKGNPESCAISRIVVLPSVQGMNFGSKICNFIGGIFKNNGNKLYIKTINPSIGLYFNNHPTLWRGTTFNGKLRKNVDCEGNKYKNRVERSSYCHEYIGEPISGYEELILPISEMRKNK